MTRAFIFPGQGSQVVGMGQALAGAFAEAREVFGEVDEALADREPLEGAMVRELRRLARLQLQALTYCYGSREF